MTELTKKPPQGAADPNYLKFAIKHYLTKAEQEPAEKERNRILLEHVRPLNRRFRGIAGRSIWWPISFGCAFAVFLVALIASKTSKTYLYQYPFDYLRVVENLDPCQPDGSCGKRFIVQSVTDDVPNPETELHFREAQHFEAGMTFQWIKYRLINGQAVTDGWDVVRGKDRLPVLAPNCSFDWANNHVVCEGGKARF